MKNDFRPNNGAIELTSEDTNDERQKLEQAIIALEAQRPILGDAVVDTAVAPLRRKLEALAAPEPPATRGLSSERRIVTVLFCDMVGSTTLAERLDPETWTTIMNRVFRLLTEPVDRYGGTVTRLMGDAILALFGAPESHEDDPERAILAGLSIMEKADSYRRQFTEETGMSFNFRVGINTGLAVVGEVGSEVRVEYTAMGNAVNVAARMEQTAAPGTVQISEATYQLVAELFEVEPLGPISVKGREAPTDAFRVLGRKAQSRRRGDERRAQLVGRQIEMERLRQIVDRVRDGQGQIVLLLGEAGLGKSRLIAELRAEWLALHGQNSNGQDKELPRWTEMSATSYSTGRPYGAFVNQIQIIAGIAPTDPMPVARDKLQRVLAADPEHEFLQPVYERLLGIHSEDQVDISSVAFMRALYDSTLKAIRNETGGRPSVIVFDDLQWVDPASLGLIEHALQLVLELPLLVLLAMRPELDAPARELQRGLSESYGHRYSEFTLMPLTGEESIQLADALLTVEAAPLELREIVLKRAEGNPFYIEELVQMLFDRGLLASSEIQTDLIESDLSNASDIPANLMSLVAARVDRLSRDVRLTLQLAAVIGRSFYVRVLREIGEAQEELEGHLGQLESAEMIRESTRRPEWEYVFRHALTQEAVYSTLLLEQRRRFHQDVGQALEQLYPGRLEEFAPALAHHFDEGQQLDKARDYYILAGKEAADLHAYDQATEYYRRALAIALEQGASSESIIELFGRLGRALEHLHRFDKADHRYMELEEWGHKRDDQAMILASLTSRTIIYANPTPLFSPEVAETLAARALTLANDMGDLAAEARICMQLCTAHSFAGKIKESLEYGDRALSLARNLGDRLLIAHVLNDLSSHLFSVIGEFDRGTRALSEAGQTWRELGDKAMEVDSLSTLAHINVYMGDFDQGIAFADEAKALSRSIHNQWGESHSQFIVGLAYWERGQPDLAITTMEASIRLGEATGFVVPQVSTRCELALVYAQLGETRTALELVEIGRKRSGTTGVITDIFVAGITALVQILCDQCQEAEETLAGYSHRLVVRPESVFYIPGIRAFAEIALHRGQLDKALSAVGQLVDFGTNTGARLYLLQALQQQATILQALNRPEEARASLREAQTLGQALGSRWTMWQIETQFGRLADDSAVAAAHFQRARALIQTISDHTPDHLRASFLGQAAVQAVLTAGEPY